MKTDRYKTLLDRVESNNLDLEDLDYIKMLVKVDNWILSQKKYKGYKQLLNDKK